MCCRMQDASAFLSFLPLDNSSNLAEAEQVVELISEDLEGVLNLPPGEFWQLLESSSSLRACLDSYLKNCRLVTDMHKQYTD